MRLAGTRRPRARPRRTLTFCGSRWVYEGCMWSSCMRITQWRAGPQRRLTVCGRRRPPPPTSTPTPWAGPPPHAGRPSAQQAGTHAGQACRPRAGRASETSMLHCELSNQGELPQRSQQPEKRSTLNATPRPGDKALPLAGSSRAVSPSQRCPPPPHTPLLTGLPSTAMMACPGPGPIICRCGPPSRWPPTQGQGRFVGTHFCIARCTPVLNLRHLRTSAALHPCGLQRHNVVSLPPGVHQVARCVI
jgi:hypothetical protein